MRTIKYIGKHIEEIISGIAVSIMLFSMAFNVFARYLFDAPTSWSDELCIICLSYVTFVGGAAAFKKNAHYGMDYLVERLPAKYKIHLRRAISFVLMILFGYMTYLGYDLTVHAVKLFSHTRWSYKLMDAALPLGFLSMTLHSVYYFILSFRAPQEYLAWYDSNVEGDQDATEQPE